MEISKTKYGFLGKIKGTINGIPFCFYARGDDAHSVHEQLVNEVGFLCAYARLAA